MIRTGATLKYRAGFFARPLFAAAIACLTVSSARLVSASEIVQFEITIARASRSGSTIDKRLTFARADLLRHGYASAEYVRGYRIRLDKGQSNRFSVGEQLSGLIQHKGVVGPKADRVQFYLVIYSGGREQAGANYSIWRGGAPGITIIPQPGAWAYMVIVRALR